ncbi:helix-turn-helix transcriptional regulator [Kitasatospora sp. NBC_01287]|uniref:winged helix-turn-helix transcriptional regulator n=1 Tax=Kitasatospora sp. NBC_01287 TaxID=2903573 RepID=UPI002250718A|nr:helix-turn-helix domain-containing protein [Kitasatospora sp. NBC_01287]MCX4746580.1 helix-turn-helix transcriptional regulator [Kitasatospora sp. NBC_01287]
MTTTSATAGPGPGKPTGRPCSIAAALQILGEKWALLAVRELFYGNHRFDRIVRNTGAPRDRLTARLRALEEAGVIERRLYQERPARYEYHLTQAGRELAPVTQALLVWGDRWAVEEPPVTLLHHAAGHPEHHLDPVWVCRTCGQESGGSGGAGDSEVSGGPGLSLDIHSPGWDRRGPVA